MPLPSIVLDPLAPPPTQPGLFQVATGPLDLPVNARTPGAVWESDVCGSARLYPTPCQAPPYTALTMDPGDPIIQAYAFNVYATEVCGAFGHEAEEAARRTRLRLQLNEETAVETALWHGGGGFTGIFETLNTAGKVANQTAVTSVVEAVSVLEEVGASAYPAQLILHARPRMAAYMAKNGLLRPDSKPNETFYGTKVSFGAGYAGTGPAAEAVTATDEYMFITGRVVVWRDPEIWVSPPDQLLDRNLNQRGLYAVRTYAVAVECYAASIKATRA